MKHIATTPARRRRPLRVEHARLRLSEEWDQASRRSVEIDLDPFSEGFLFELQVSPALAPDGAPMWPRTAFYTLNARP